MDIEMQNRIKTYFDALSFIDDSNNEYESYYTISSLSNLLNLPITVIRQDIYTLIKTTRSISFLEIEYDNIEDIKPQLLSGNLDNESLYAPYYNKSYEISLTEEEAFAYNQLNNTNIKSSHNFYDIHILNNIDFFPEDVINKISIINDSFTFQCALNITYTSPKIGTFNKKIVPEKLVYDSFENTYYLLTYENQTIYSYRLDRIIDIDLDTSLPSNYIQPDSSVFNIIPNVWGMAFQEKPEKVKIRFYNEANVFNKVKIDLACRTNGKIYEKNNYLYYEDTVYGISSFKNWLLRYGSSAIVIRPESLKAQIIDSYKKRIELYNK